MKFIKSIPMATCGLSLAFVGLGNLLFPLPHGHIIRYICGVLSLGVLVIFALKLFLDSAHSKEELKNPLPLSVLPTTTMSIMLLSSYIQPYIGYFAVVIWYAAIVVQFCIILIFVKRFVLGFKLATVFPTWFVVGVGVAAPSLTASAMGAPAVGQVAFYAGFAFYFVILPLIVIRLNKVKVFPEPARNTLVVFTAPMSILVVGYFNSFAPHGHINEMLVYIMLVIAAISYLYVSVMMFFLLRVKFYPTYAAFTFPYVISAIAFRQGADFLVPRHGLDFLITIADITMWIAVAIVVFVLQHYIRYFRSCLSADVHAARG